VLAHLRSVKDPLMSARAVRRLPDSSGITVHHAGAALDPDWQHAARLEASLNPRWIWHGELDAAGALDLLSTAAVLACTSASEGGANVVTEAIAMGVPVVGTRIDGNTGLLGDAYPGLVPVGDDETLARLLLRLERSPSALAELQRHVDQLGPLTSPDRERAALGAVVEALLAPAN